MRISISLSFLLIWCTMNAQTVHSTTIVPQANEYWWGGVVAFGSRMPYKAPVAMFDLSLQNNNNQVVPLFVSSKGRYLWSDRPFKFQVADSSATLHVQSEYENLDATQVGSTLREAYLAASSKHFPPSGNLPDSLFFTMPQYNTWIELMYNQNQADILRYAHAIIDNGFPPGVLMVDDNWQKYYGNFEFKPDKFPNPKAMIEELHQLGFKVMLWVCPFVSADSPEYRALEEKGLFLRKEGKKQTAIVPWWNGQSACFDLTNPQAMDYYVAQLKQLQSVYGIDGFKFDAGDNSFYNPKNVDSYQADALSVDHTLAWAKLGLSFPFNEYRAGWRMGGQALVQRLGDKAYSWRAVQSLIPEMIAAGLLGYAYTCPDMIGGGSFATFLGIDSDKFDQDLIVRSAQIHALMPMMQFSVAPWRILDKEHLEATRSAALLHQKMGGYILDCAKQSALTGEPIVQHMEYAFPNQGFAECKDQFMLGSKYLVAPIVKKEYARTVKLPKGKWRDDAGTIHKGGTTKNFNVPLGRLLYFEKM